MAILAFDHRGQFSRSVLGVGPDNLSPAQLVLLKDAKSLIFEAFLAARGTLDPEVRAGVLVDEEYGSSVLHQASRRDYILAMPVERADQRLFEFEYGAAFGEHLDTFQPDMAKALVRYNVGSSWQVKESQLRRLKALSDFLVASGRRFMFELIVVPTEAQLQAAGGDILSFEDSARAELVRAAMQEVQSAGIQVSVWKLQGISDQGDAERIAAQARKGANNAECVVLGAAAHESRVDRWMRVAAITEGFNGFAIGRNIWRDCIGAWISGNSEYGKVVRVIGQRYLQYVDRYRVNEQ